MSQIIRFNPSRAAAVRDGVTLKCNALGLCRKARDHALARAFRTLREGRSTAVAVAEGRALAMRLAAARFVRYTPGPAA